MSTLQKLLYWLFALLGVILLLFATGQFQPATQTLLNDMEWQQEIVSDALQVDADMQEEESDMPDSDWFALPVSDVEIIVLEAWDQSQPLFQAYNFDWFAERTSFRFDTTMWITQVLWEETEFFQETMQELAWIYLFTIEQTDPQRVSSSIAYETLEISVDGSEMLLDELEWAMDQLRNIFLDTNYEFSITSWWLLENLSAQYMGDDMLWAEYVEQFTETIRDIFFILPDQLVWVWWSWQVDKSVFVDGIDVRNSVIYTLVSIDDDIATLTLEVEQYMDDELIGTWWWTMIVREDLPFPLLTDIIVNATVVIPMPGMEIVMDQSVSTVTRLIDEQ